MYRNLADYGLIGDMRSAALVSSDGSIDYCSIPWLDSPTVFAALLDDRKGGFFSVRPTAACSTAREYVPGTNIHACTFTTDSGRARLHDFMPVEQTRQPHRPQGIHRCLTILDGTVEMEVTFSPRGNYGLQTPVIVREKNGFGVKGIDPALFLAISTKNCRTEGTGTGTLRITVPLREGESIHIDLFVDAGDAIGQELHPCPFDATKRYWEEWLHYCVGERCEWLGKFTPSIHRSLLVLKLLSIQPTGAIAAAATTSLPETPGGGRNWDYRYTWLRDASFTLKALFALGHVNEADSFIRWLHNTYRKNGSRNLQIMYSIRGEPALEEHELPHLEGYRRSAPVRTGNAAWQQRQWDIYGEVMDAALRLSDYAGRIDEELWPFFAEICDMAAANWRKPDDGIWEVRNGPHHFVYSKVMCWVALDRGLTIAKRFGFKAPVERWAMEREIIKEDVLLRGFSRSRNSFVQRYGSDGLDASLLLLPLVNFLPFSDSRIQGTIDACMTHLMQEGFVRRYLADDGLEGREGGFVLCNFWLIECLALSGRIPEAEETLERTMAAANDLGLLSEEYDPTEKTMLGNFPQAFSHIGYINAISALSGKAPSGSRMQEPSLRSWLRRLIPFQLTLNGTAGAAPVPAEAPEGIDAELKRCLGRLQGGFFDVREGMVDYRAMKRSESFGQYLRLAATLALFDPGKLTTDRARKAFWINIYNILIIHGVIALDIRRSVLEIVNFFGRIGYLIGENYYSPDDIEHGILRKNRPHPAFPTRPFHSSDPRLGFCVRQFDPRIHFALVCASSSCPPIEFYDAETIDRQLDTAARSFINRRGLELDRSRRELKLSRVFQWYAKDFGSTQQEMLDFILQFAEPSVRDEIEEFRGQALKIRYLPYNWNLNSRLG